MTAMLTPLPPPFINDAGCIQNLVELAAHEGFQIGRAHV